MNIVIAYNIIDIECENIEYHQNTNFEKNFNLFEIFKKHKLINVVIQKINILKRIYENINKMKKHFLK